ncbi:MAG: aldo/keto reductase [Chthoniobacterales bacterium]|nr:MAG: aldo/keto reductase [Chthoniobacterales bacterium]
MEKRQLGNTDMHVSVLGFGGAEIGFEGATEETVKQLLESALDAGLNVIDTGECYEGSEEIIGNTVGARRSDFYLFTKAGHPRGVGSEDWSPASLLESIERSLRRLRTDRLDLIQLHGCSESVLRKGDAIAALQTARERGYARYLGYSGDSLAAKYAVECGAFDTLQTSISVADQEALDLTLPRAREQKMGVIAKRPIANAAWKENHKPIESYHHAYWDRLNKLHYDFIRHRPLEESIAHALRFTLSVPGVHTAIVGTAKPERWVQNARLVEAGLLSKAEFEAVRERWEEIAPATWIGQT